MMVNIVEKEKYLCHVEDYNHHNIYDVLTSIDRPLRHYKIYLLLRILCNDELHIIICTPSYKYLFQITCV